MKAASLEDGDRMNLPMISYMTTEQVSWYHTAHIEDYTCHHMYSYGNETYIFINVLVNQLWHVLTVTTWFHNLHDHLFVILVYMGLQSMFDEYAHNAIYIISSQWICMIWCNTMMIRVWMHTVYIYNIHISYIKVLYHTIYRHIIMSHILARVYIDISPMPSGPFANVLNRSRTPGFFPDLEWGVDGKAPGSKPRPFAERSSRWSLVEIYCYPRMDGLYLVGG